MKNQNSFSRIRLRTIVPKIGFLPVGELNSIADVPGVTVGHSTINKGNGKLVPGEGPIRTGVTIIKPHQGNIYREKVRASSFVLNGYGKTTGLVQVSELGYIESYIGLTNTFSVSQVADALLDYHLSENPDIGVSTSSINVLVAECNDGYLNDLQGRHVKSNHVQQAIHSASDKVTEGNVGAGTGMKALGFKAGIGTSSRVISGDGRSFVVGALVLSNFGSKKQLRILGKQFVDKEDKEVNVSSLQKNEENSSSNAGSIIIILATNAPLTSRQLKRLSKRAPLAIARVGGLATNSSGDIIICFSTENKIQHDSKETVFSLEAMNESSKLFNDLIQAVVESTEEAIYNSLTMAKTMIGRDEHLVQGISIEALKRMLR